MWIWTLTPCIAGPRHKSRPPEGFTGAVLAVLGAILLAADKGALCLTMSALDTVPQEEFSAMMPGLSAMFSKKGWMIFLCGTCYDLPARDPRRVARARAADGWAL